MNHAVQFDDVEQQRSATLLGIWIFLATEVLFFGGMLVAYIVYRYEYPEAFSLASEHLNVWLGGAMTAVLLLGSLLVAIADHLIQQDDDPSHVRRAVFQRLMFTALLGLAFLSCEFYEYYEVVTENLFPGANFDVAAFASASIAGRLAQMFFVLYFCMTGLHALHMIVGVSLVTWMAVVVRWSGPPCGWANTLNVVGLYWHFVDIVWIFLYPLFYLVA
ncbi:cytochrome c oxidase subunit 3 [Novipirellula rosea]|uniref:Cytochrome c oxidase subunit 3 family protein n=1 Tax=Novipirellula rosea TaxID=1031540 RepID=A0ABP8NIW2_9BACT